jgi:multiple sugar transport system permease protein
MPFIARSGSSMPTETRQRTSRARLQAQAAALPVRREPSRHAAGRVSLNPLPALVLALFAVFFVLPVLWLVLATAKTGDQLVYGSPLSFGSWHALRANWDALTRYQGDAISLWLRNSAVYSFLALAITLAVVIPVGYVLAMTEFRGRRALLIATLVVMVMPNTTLVVPLFLEINAVHLIGSMWSIALTKPHRFLCERAYGLDDSAAVRSFGSASP